MVKIYYFSPDDIFRPRAHQISDVRFCEGFAQNNTDVELIAPYIYRKDNLKMNQVFDFYGVKSHYKTRILKTFFPANTPRKIFALATSIFIFFISLRIFLFNFVNLRKVIIISRSVDLLMPSIILKKLFRFRSRHKNIIWVHEIVAKRRYRWAYRNSDGVIATNSAIIDDLRKGFNIPRKKIAISLNPITEFQLQNVVDKSKARKILALSNEMPIIVYTGKLYLGQKEAEYILESAKNLPSYQFLLTGGKSNVVAYYKKFCEKQGIFNVTFTGYIHKYSIIQYYQFAADVLISYYSKKDHNVRYSLPNKICEYMLTRNPIVTPLHPAVCDILNCHNAIIVEADNVNSLVEGICNGVENRQESKKLAEKAFRDIQEITFKKRTRILLNFFNQLENICKL